jgi:hypothetical protein
MTTPFAATVEDGVLAGPVRAPRNSAKHLGAGSIHDDATAQKLGFRGGTVAGSLHMEQFPPLLAEVFGERWFRTGGLSLYFRYATTDGEPVQAFAEKPDSMAEDQQTRVWMDDPKGTRICDGTASVGAPDPESECRQRIASVPPAQDIRILAQLTVGDRSQPVPTRLSAKALDARLQVITEPLPAYVDASVWGHRIATPAQQVHVMRPAENEILRRGRDFGVGLFGAIELQYLAGPVFVEYDYQTWARVLAIGETPKTEYFWYESTLVDPATGRDVSRMLMMLRFMKASSKHWQ